MMIWLRVNVQVDLEVLVIKGDDTMDELDLLLDDIEMKITDARSIIYEQENYIERLEEKLDDDNTIYDLRNFKRQLEIQNLITPELTEFIDSYMRFSNS